MARTRFCYHPWQLDSANPWRNDGNGFNITTTPMASLRLDRKAGNQNQEWDPTHEFFEEPNLFPAQLYKWIKF
uniref:Uncharacterized protein n=1 Tax=Candidatus Kentrum sp. LPFa TaxID=2126335 RepID=A0A450W6K2_9GAMM|nr:MAG: hypothetical protein BECKLPF1236A_GA0070988_1007415 [Candidatus Kentron sp. LPFa]VFK28973.1 MAG: hypothetical protein BECKLPF1236C_GA0070990_100782 [Candidatus Kentron sp. LPFa]